MVSPLHTKNHSRQTTREGGFTLLEVMMVVFISSFVFAGVLSAYVFLGRGLARQVNAESLESGARVALSYVNQDVSCATGITAINPGPQVNGTLITLSVPAAGTVTTVTYNYIWDPVSMQGSLTRTAGSGVSTQTTTLLKNLATFSFEFYDATGSLITVPSTAPIPFPPQINIKQVNMSYTAAAGYAASGAQSQFTVVSPLVTMNNKIMLKDPNDPPDSYDP
jgi:prepilin-type N-terminal cleavage/methylation domain-containing protein